MADRPLWVGVSGSSSRATYAVGRGRVERPAVATPDVADQHAAPEAPSYITAASRIPG